MLLFADTHLAPLIEDPHRILIVLSSSSPPVALKYDGHARNGFSYGSNDSVEPEQQLILIAFNGDTFSIPDANFEIGID